MPDRPGPLRLVWIHAGRAASGALVHLGRAGARSGRPAALVDPVSCLRPRVGWWAASVRVYQVYSGLRAVPLCAAMWCGFVRGLILSLYGMLRALCGLLDALKCKRYKMKPSGNAAGGCGVCGFDGLSGVSGAVGCAACVFLRSSGAGRSGAVFGGLVMGANGHKKSPLCSGRALVGNFQQGGEDKKRKN